MPETISFSPEKEKSRVNLSLQGKALVFGMLYDKKDAVTSYRMDRGVKKLDCISEDKDFDLLVQKFKKNPKDTLAFGRNNLMEIMKDRHLTQRERRERVERYVDAYFDLMIKLDHEAFPPDDVLRRGVPDYIPDGLSDMGSDEEVDPQFRQREKIRVDKKNIFNQAKELFYDCFGSDFSKIDLSNFKKSVVSNIATFVYNKMPYNYSQKFPNIFGRSVPISDIYEKKLAVCRHHALYAQVLMQAFGLSSKLLKCDVNYENGKGFGAHVANLVRIDNKFYLLDVTSPDKKGGIGKVYMKPLPEKNVDTNKYNYVWDLPQEAGIKHRKYRSRNKMYYRIRKNY